MQVNTCIKTLLNSRPDVTAVDLSARLGRARSWASNVAAPTRSPALATVADVADVLGYRLDVVDRETGEVVGSIEPPRRAADREG